MRTLKLLSATLALALAVPAALGHAEEPPKKEAAAGKSAGAVDPKAEEAKMMEAWKAFATPGAEHKKLEAMVGSWDATTTMWMAPGAPPMESKGTSEMKMILGGRYLEQRHQGTFMEMPFEGVGTSTFDNYKKKYLSTWIDNMGTSIMYMEGRVAKDGSTVETGKMDDIVAKRPANVKTISKMADNDHLHFEMWVTGPDGKTMFKTMVIEYTRKK